MKYRIKDIHFKLILLSIVVGILAGLISGVFRWLLVKALEIRQFIFIEDREWIFKAATFIVIWGIAWLVYRLNRVVPLIDGDGIPQSEGAIIGRFSFMRPIQQLIGKFIGSLGVIGVGFSLGREGPSIQFGTLVGSLISKIFRLNPTQKRYLKTAGAAGGLSATFSAPLASAVFIIEDLLGWSSIRIILPTLIACVAANYCAELFFPYNQYSMIPVILPKFGEVHMFVVLAIFAVICALISKLFNLSLYLCGKTYEFLKIPPFLKIGAISVFVFLMGMFFVDLTGSGEQALFDQALEESGVLSMLLLMIVLKIVFTTLSYVIGIGGSLILPLIVTGGLIGKAFGLILVSMDMITPDNLGFFTLLGIGVFFISSVRAPITGLLLTIEITGQYKLFYPLIVAGAIAYFLGSFLQIIPLYTKIYKKYLDKEVKLKLDKITMNMQVNDDSYAINRTVSELPIPKDCEVIELLRNQKNSIPIQEDTVIHNGDILVFKLHQRDYEELFKMFRAMTNE